MEVASKASTAEGVSDSDTGLVSLNKEFTCTSPPESRSPNGSNSQWSAGNATRDSSAERIPALAKHFLIVDSDTLSHAWAIHLIACSKSTDLHTSVAELQSSILLTTCVSISFMYLSLNAWIIPRSRGCNLDVQFAGKKLSYLEDGRGHCPEIRSHFFAFLLISGLPWIAPYRGC